MMDIPVDQLEAVGAGIGLTVLFIIALTMGKK